MIGSATHFLFKVYPELDNSLFAKFYNDLCNLSPEEKDEEVYCYKVTGIDMPVAYDIDNEIYKNRYIHITIDLYPGNIIFLWSDFLIYAV